MPATGRVNVIKRPVSVFRCVTTTSLFSFFMTFIKKKTKWQREAAALSGAAKQAPFNVTTETLTRSGLVPNSDCGPRQQLARSVNEEDFARRPIRHSTCRRAAFVVGMTPFILAGARHPLSLSSSLAEWRARGILHPRHKDLGPSANFTIRLWCRDCRLDFRLP